jgi:hypothetical protein
MIAGPSQRSNDLNQSQQTPTKGRLFQLQRNEEIDTISESEISGDIIPEDDSPQETSKLVRTISRTATTKIENISINTSYQQISSSLELFNRISQSRPHNEPTASSDIRPEAPSHPPLVIPHSGKLITRCGDCMSSVITSKILKR